MTIQKYIKFSFYGLSLAVIAVVSFFSGNARHGAFTTLFGNDIAEADHPVVTTCGSRGDAGRDGGGDGDGGDGGGSGDAGGGNGSCGGCSI